MGGVCSRVRELSYGSDFRNQKFDERWVLMIVSKSSSRVWMHECANWGLFGLAKSSLSKYKVRFLTSGIDIDVKQPYVMN